MEQGRAKELCTYLVGGKFVKADNICWSRHMLRMEGGHVVRSATDFQLQI